MLANNSGRSLPVRRRSSAVFVDIGGVLIRDPQPIVCDKIRRIVGPLPHGFPKLYAQLSRRLDLGSIHLHSAYESICAALGTTIGYRRFEVIVTSASLTAYPGVLKALDRLSKKGIPRVYLASNTSREVWRGLNAKYHLGDRYKRQILSYRVACLKPQVRFFRLMLEKAKCSPQNALFLDNSRRNVVGARKLGIRSILVQRPSQAALLLRRLAQGT